MSSISLANVAFVVVWLIPFAFSYATYHSQMGNPKLAKFLFLLSATFSEFVVGYWAFVYTSHTIGIAVTVFVVATFASVGVVTFEWVSLNRRFPPTKQFYETAANELLPDPVAGPIPSRESKNERKNPVSRIELPETIAAEQIEPDLIILGVSEPEITDKERKLGVQIVNRSGKRLAVKLRMRNVVEGQSYGDIPLRRIHSPSAQVGDQFQHTLYHEQTQDYHFISQTKQNPEEIRLTSTALPNWEVGLRFTFWSLIWWVLWQPIIWRATLNDSLCSSMKNPIFN